MSTARLLVLLREEVEGEVVEGGLLRNHRRARKPTMATAMSCGMLIEVWVSAILAGFSLVASWSLRYVFYGWVFVS